MAEPSSRVDRLRPGDERFGWAKKVEYEIFGLENDFADERDRDAGEMTHYRRWERSSEFYVGFDADAWGGPVAVLRALRWDPSLGLDSFSTLHDIRRFPAPDGAERDILYPRWSAFFDTADPQRIAELATQGVRRSSRRAGAMERIWRVFFADLAREGVELVTVALVTPLFEWYQQLLPDRVHQIGDVLPDYIGADSIPAVVDISGTFVARMVRGLDQGHGSLLAASAGEKSRTEPGQNQDKEIA